MILYTFAQVHSVQITAYCQDDTHLLVLRRGRMSHPAAQVLLHPHRVHSESPLGAAVAVTPMEQNLGYKYLGPDRPGQPRLDSGSLSVGWFLLPDAVRGLLGCHPLVPHCQSSSTSEKHWVTSAVVHVTCVLSWATGNRDLDSSHKTTTCGDSTRCC